MKITDIDKNFIQESVNNSDNWISALCKPFSIYGISYDNTEKCFIRMPLETVNKLNDRIKALNKYTAGGRIRFKTTSDFICLKYITTTDGWMTHMPLTGSHGFSVYENKRFCGKISPPVDSMKNGGDVSCEGKVWLLTNGVKDIEIYFPLYACVKELYLSFSDVAEVLPADKYEDRKILYYGSSITQGGCASRPGNDYQSYIERWTNTDFINLGFAGNAKGEQEIAEYIVDVKPEIVVMDYDHNATNAQYLNQTHYSFYNIVRKGLPNSIIVLMSKPDFLSTNIDDVNRRKIIKSTYKKAIKQGDKKIIFIDGSKLFGKDDTDSCTIDRIHPNDLGFYRIAKKVYSNLKILNI